LRKSGEQGGHSEQRKLVDRGKAISRPAIAFYTLLSVLEPQKEIWRRPSKKVFITLVVAWSAFPALLHSFLSGMLSGKVNE
jgi:hypothetical protein